MELQQTKRKNSYLGFIIIAGTLAILMLIIVMAIAIFIIARQFDPGQSNQANSLLGVNPLSQLDTEEIDPALALASLGGLPEIEVIDEAIDKSRPETALADLLFAATLSNKESAGGFLQLARAYANGGANEKAIFSYKMAATIATLAPDIADTVRADLFLQVSEGLIEVDEATLTKFYLDQAFSVAARSPFLQAAHRRAILERLQKNYIIIGERVLARQSLSLSANAPGLVQPVENLTALPVAKPVSFPETIQIVEAKRWRVAQELSLLLVERGGKTTPESIDALTEALIAEDLQKLPFFEKEFNQTTQLSKKIDLTQAKIIWLSTKYRVARQGYGLTLVPEWEDQAEQIRADLTKTYEILYALYADLVIALPEISQIDKATEEKLRSEILAGQLGRYPNYPEEQRQKQLLDATDQLIATQSEIQLFVSVSVIESQDIYTLISVE